MENRRAKEKATANTGISPLRRKERASGRDDRVLGWVEESGRAELDAYAFTRG